VAHFRRNIILGKKKGQLKETSHLGLWREKKNQRTPEGGGSVSTTTTDVKEKQQRKGGWAEVRRKATVRHGKVGKGGCEKRALISKWRKEKRHEDTNHEKNEKINDRGQVLVK